MWYRIAMSEEYLILVSYVTAFVLGLMSMHYRRAAMIALLLFIPAIWLFATFAPELLGMPAANRSGFMSVYIKFYEGLSPEAMRAVLLFPLIFFGGRFAYFIFKAFFYKERVENMNDRKKRVKAMYGIID